MKGLNLDLLEHKPVGYQLGHLCGMVNMKLSNTFMADKCTNRENVTERAIDHMQLPGPNDNGHIRL